MEPEGSSPQSQVPANCPYPEPARSIPYPPHPTSWRSILILPSYLRLGFPSGLFSSGFPTWTLYRPLLSPIRATFPAHPILLDFITRTIMGEEYRTLSSSLCSFLHSPVTSSLLDPNILLNILFSNTLSLGSNILSLSTSRPLRSSEVRTNCLSFYLLILGGGGATAPQWAINSSFTRFLDHTQRRSTFGRTPLDMWSARRRDLYLTTHNIHNRQTSMPPVGFEPTIWTGERPQNYALDRAATATGNIY